MTFPFPNECPDEYTSKKLPVWERMWISICAFGFVTWFVCYMWFLVEFNKSKAGLLNSVIFVLSFPFFLVVEFLWISFVGKILNWRNDVK